MSTLSKPNILFDTNIILDVFQKRQPHYPNSVLLFDMAVKKELNGFMCATTITTISYLMEKYFKKDMDALEARKEVAKKLAKLLHYFKIAPVDHAVVVAAATDTAFEDFEDAVLYHAALSLQLDAIVTRNTDDFRQAAGRGDSIFVNDPATQLDLILNPGK